MFGRVNIIQTDDGIKVIKANELLGYVENDVLFGIGSDGYAHEVGTIQHTSEITGKLEAWRDTNYPKSNGGHQLTLQNPQSPPHA